MSIIQVCQWQLVRGKLFSRLFLRRKRIKILIKCKRGGIKVFCFYMTGIFYFVSQVRLYDPRLCEPNDKLRSLYEKSKNISCTQLLQEGTFGQIYRGQLRVREDHTEDVVIKTVTGNILFNFQFEFNFISW